MKEYSLEQFGEPVSRYAGTGHFHVDGRSRQCEFQAAQYPSGSIRIICEVAEASLRGFFDQIDREQPTSFEGVCRDGARIVAAGSTHVLSYSSQLGEGPPRSVYVVRATRLIVSARTGKAATRRLGLVNCLFSGTTLEAESGLQLLPVTVPLDNEAHSTEVVLAPIQDYEQRTDRLRTIKGCEVTAELRIDPELPFQTCATLADCICRVLSVGRGTKVQWVYAQDYDAGGSVLRSEHISHVTKPYSGLAAIPSRYEMRQATKRLLELGTKALLDLHADIPEIHAVIESYVDAKAEGDYIELRSAKLAVTLESLRWVLSKVPRWGINDYVLSSEFFENQVLPRLSDTLKEVFRVLAVHQNDAQAIAAHGKLAGLNRRSFAHQLRSLVRSLKLDIGTMDIRLFVACRNKLVHTGTFYCKCASDAEKTELPPPETPAHEFLFLVHILDQVFLKLLNYSGPYIDWREPGSPRQKTLA